jgi:hypothetical protein
MAFPEMPLNAWLKLRCVPLTLLVLGQSLPAQAAPLLKDVHLKWEGQQLVLYAAFNQPGHDLPITLAWRAAGDMSEHRGEIDYIEQYAQGMPLAITVASLAKNAAGRDVLYVGQPRANSPKIEGAGAVTGHIALEGDEDYAFTILPRTAAEPALKK